MHVWMYPTCVYNLCKCVWTRSKSYCESEDSLLFFSNGSFARMQAVLLRLVCTLTFAKFLCYSFNLKCEIKCDRSLCFLALLFTFLVCTSLLSPHLCRQAIFSLLMYFYRRDGEKGWKQVKVCESMKLSCALSSKLPSFFADTHSLSHFPLFSFGESRPKVDLEFCEHGSHQQLPAAWQSKRGKCSVVMARQTEWEEGEQHCESRALLPSRFRSV